MPPITSDADLATDFSEIPTNGYLEVDIKKFDNRNV